MANRGYYAAISAIASVVVVAAAFPPLAPVIDSALSGARIDMGRLLGSVGVHTIAGFWASGSWVAHIAQIVACLVITWLVVFACCLLSALRSSREADAKIFGDATLVESNAALNRKNDFWDGCSTPKNAGLVLGACRGGYWYDSSVPHALVVGKTGSGKGQLIVLETLHLLMSAKWNILATGKPEILELTGDKARDLGYEVVVLDLNGYPGASGYNPLDLVTDALEREDDDAAVRIARQVAVDVIPIGGEKNTYFPKAARNALTAFILVVCTADIPREQKNLSSVAALVQRGTAGDDPRDPSRPLKQYIRDLGADHLAFAPASDFLGDGGVTTAGKNVISTLKDGLSIFSDGALRAITSVSTISIRDVIGRRTVVYLEMMEENHPYSVVYASFLNQWWTVAQEVAREKGGVVPHETAIVGDEIGNTGKVTCLPAITTLGRSMGVHAYLIVQNLKQLNVYNEPGDGGAGRDKLIGSIGTKVALSLSEPSDFKFFTELCGKRTMRSKGIGSQRSAGKASSSVNFNETSVPLVNEWEWQSRVPVRDGAIAIKGGENSAPGRAGVFRLPLNYASTTPAGAFFGLGDIEHERRKKEGFYARARANAEGSGAKRPPDLWCPAFDSQPGDAEEELRGEIERDEWTAWDD